MQVIPVLDLLDGHAVRAVRGERARYRPIQSSLCATSEPLAVAEALLAVTGARTLYIADLAAILARGDHAEQLAALLDGLQHTGPDFEIWLDAGYVDFPSMRTLFSRIEAFRHAGALSHTSDTRTSHTPRATLVPVFGTETLRDRGALREADAAGFAPVLSLDHRAGLELSDSAATSRDTSWWPSRVIVMTLDQVGSYQGPDLDTLAAVHARAGDRTLIGAGGIRHAGDLSAAAHSGAAAWLVASALHDQRLDALRVGKT
jgi:phosphoribosylformimino-5-aminoimidazole carboxamide ribotide isomerase